MADYSTTMGILQPQVGKSGDILLKFEHKNGGERGIRTLGTLRYTAFPMRRLRPLDQLSAFYKAYFKIAPLAKKTNSESTFFSEYLHFSGRIFASFIHLLYINDICRQINLIPDRSFSTLLQVSLQKHYFFNTGTFAHPEPASVNSRHEKQ